MLHTHVQQVDFDGLGLHANFDFVYETAEMRSPDQAIYFAPLATVGSAPGARNLRPENQITAVSNKQCAHSQPHERLVL